MRIIYRAVAVAMVVGLGGCSEESTRQPDAAVADAALDSRPSDGPLLDGKPVDGNVVDVRPPDGPAIDGPSPDAPLLSEVLNPDADMGDAGPHPELALLTSELSNIVTRPGRELSSLAVLAIDEGEVSYERHFGYAYINNAMPSANVPAGTNTLYRVASMSKMVTAIGVMKLVDAGKVDLDKDASLYIGFKLRNPNFPDVEITPRMLLSHRSSLRDDAGYSPPITTSLESMLTPTGANYTAAAWAVRDVATNQAPGAHFSFANLNYGLLGSVIEGASQQRFDKYMRDNVLAPLGIKGGYYPADLPADVLSQVATLYRKGDGAGVWNPSGPWVAQKDDFRAAPPEVFAGLQTYGLAKNGTLFAPHGGLRISISDMGKIMQLLLNNGRLNGIEILKPASVNAMEANEWTFNGSNGDTSGGLFQSWGLGMQRFTDKKDADRLLASAPFSGFGHLGEAHGLYSGFVYDPITSDGMIYVIGGVGSNPDEYVGAYSKFHKWEEDIMSALHRRAIARDTSP